MINDLVKFEVIRLKDALDNYQRGSYSKDRAEDLIIDAAQTILQTVRERKGESHGNLIQTRDKSRSIFEPNQKPTSKAKPSGRPKGGNGKPYAR